ncbi:MAG: hypothetical protein RR404_02300 [Bacilli bacterium]
MKNDELSNNKFVVLSITLVTLVAFCAFLIGYGINQGECPKCNDKTVIKVFTTTNNVENTVDYNMMTSIIRKDLVGKYVNELDSKVYFEINRDGTFKFVKNNCNEYKTFTNEDYVLLLYYSQKEVIPEVEADDDIKSDKEKKQIIYNTSLTMIPKKQIKEEIVVDSIITFVDEEPTSDGISVSFIGPTTCSKNNRYIKK